MRKGIIFLGCIFCLLLANGQVKFGIRAGIHTGSVSGSDVLVFNQNQLDTLKIKAENASVGFRIGVISRIKLGNFYVQPEAVFRTTSRDYSISDAVQNTGELEFRNENGFLIDIPILAGVKLGPLRIQGGPIASLLLNTNSKLEEVDNFNRSFNAAKWALQYGAGLDLGNLSIDVNRQSFLSSTDDTITIGNTDFDLGGDGDFWVFALAIFF